MLNQDFHIFQTVLCDFGRLLDSVADTLGETGLKWLEKQTKKDISKEVVEKIVKNANDCTKYTDELMEIIGLYEGRTDDIIEYVNKNGDDGVEEICKLYESGTYSKYLEQLDGFSENKINHIINGSKGSNHGWEKLVPDKNWGDIKNIMAKVMETGVEGPYKTVYSKKTIISGYEVEVTYNKLNDGVIKISDAWVNQ